MRHRYRGFLQVLGILLPVLTATSARAELITNGSFETPSIGSNYAYVPGGLTTIYGWETVLSGVEWFVPLTYHSWGVAADGVQALDLNTDYAVGGGIQQTFPTTAGTSYTLSFSGGTLVDGGRSGTGTIEVLINGDSHLFTVENHGSTIAWTRFSIPFQATGPTSTVVFRNFELQAATFAFLDAVSVVEAGELITNGGFETPSIGSDYAYVPGGLTTISGWETILSGVEWFVPLTYHSWGVAADGVQALDLNTDYAVGGGIQQTFPTTAGTPYTLSFSGGTLVDGGRSGTGTIEVLINGDSHLFTVENHGSTIAWTRFSIPFQATGPTSTVVFRNFELQAASFAFLDAVSVVVTDSDRDGVPDNVDDYPNSDLRPTVVIDGCDTRVSNHLFVNNAAFGNGRTIADLINQLAAGANNHGEFVSGVVQLTNALKSAGIISQGDQSAIQSCAVHSSLP